MIRFCLAMCLLVLNSCGTAPSSSDGKNVFGSDNRVALTTSSYPWNTIGRVVQPSGAACTGTLVAKNLVLTAAHCIIDPATKALKVGTFNFQPNYKNGEAVATYRLNYFWWGTNDPDKFRWADWAIVQTAENAGDRFSWIGTRGLTIDNFPNELTVAGYSNNFQSGNTAGVHHNCSTKKRDTTKKFILHDCDTSRGSSGGPALRMYDNKLTVIGINVAEFRDGGETSLVRPAYEDKFANIVIPSVDAVTKLRSILGLESPE